MGELYPTKTRLALLRDVDNGCVLDDITADDAPTVLFPNAPTEWQTRQKVDARIRELERAGWVELDEAGVNWRLTDAGRKVLEVTVPP